MMMRLRWKKIAGTLPLGAVIVLFLWSIIGISYGMANMPPGSAQAVESGNMQTSITILAMIFNGCAFFGGLLFLSKKYMTKIDQIAEATPTMVETMKTIQECLAGHEESISSHYRSLEAHSLQLKEIETIHRLRGCDKTIKAPSSPPGGD